MSKKKHPTCCYMYSTKLKRHTVNMYDNYHHKAISGGKTLLSRNMKQVRKRETNKTVKI